jgi:hypothetical protein
MIAIHPNSLAKCALMAVATIASVGLAAPADARDSLGMFGSWGAFRDSAVPRCYAIAKAVPSTMSRDYQPYATVGTWPKRPLRNQIHFRMSRKLASDPRLVLRIGGKSFKLAGGGGDAWAADNRMNAAITAAMRSASSMTVSASGANGKRFSNTWQLAGVASAMDAAAIGCVRAR